MTPSVDASELRELAARVGGTPLLDNAAAALLSAASRIEQVRAETIEECAKVCEELQRSWKKGEGGDWQGGCIQCADAIRALAQSKLREDR